MKRPNFSCATALAVCLFSGGAGIDSAAAGSSETVIAAIDWLAEQSNPPWKSEVEAPFDGGSTEGRASKAGLTLVRAPEGDDVFEFAMKGDHRAVVSDEVWRSLEQETSTAGQGAGFRLRLAGVLSMHEGPDGGLYFVEYGGWFTPSPKNKLARIVYEPARTAAK